MYIFEVHQISKEKTYDFVPAKEHECQIQNNIKYSSAGPEERYAPLFEVFSLREEDTY